MAMVSVTMTAGPVAPSKFFVAPGGRSLNNRGYTMGLAPGYNTVLMHEEELAVLMAPGDDAIGADGQPLHDGNGKAIKNRDLVQAQAGGAGLSIADSFTIIKTADVGKAAAASAPAATSRPASKKESK